MRLIVAELYKKIRDLSDAMCTLTLLAILYIRHEEFWIFNAVVGAFAVFNMVVGTFILWKTKHAEHVD